MLAVIMELLGRLHGLFERLAGRREVYWLLGLIAVWIAARSYARFVSRKKPLPTGPSPLDFDLGVLPVPDESVDELLLHVYHIPVRLGVVVIAPLGRDGKPPAGDDVPELLDHAVPGLGRLLRHDRTQLRLWPVQLSSTGFVHSLSRHVALPGAAGKGTPWCLVAGKVVTGTGQYVIGTALCAAEPNNLGLLSVESEHQWLDVLRISASSSQA